MIKLFKILTVFVFLCVSYTLAFADDYVFKPGEEVHYKVVQMGIKVGDAKITFVGPTQINDVDTLLIEFLADGFNFLDHEKIYVDPTTFKPLTVIRDLNIFGKKEKIVETYFPQDNKILIEKTVGKTITKQELVKAGEVDNIYGFIFRFRQEGKMKVGDQFDVNLPTKDIKMQVVKKVKISVDGDKVDSVYLESKPAAYKLWFDTTPKGIPLRISGSIGLSNTTMYLTKYKE